ncbi:MAG: EAL domain-containing protein [Parasporobacterium sp.]|nr:EAL domain-containing protein [Parasporobacterium sp.]
MTLFEYTGQIDYRFDLCAIVLLVILALKFFVSRRFPSLSNRVFGIIIGCAFLCVAFDIGGSILINIGGEGDIPFSMVVNSLYFLSLLAITMLLFVYVFYSSGYLFRNKHGVEAMFIPVVITSILTVTNSFSGLIFTLEMVGDTMVYNHGPALPAIYASCYFYMISSFVLTFKAKNKLSHMQRIMIRTFSGILLITSICQLLISDILIMGVSISVGIMLMMFTIQNPENMVDPVSKAFDYQALGLYYDSLRARNNDVHIVVLEIDGIGAIDKTRGMILGNEIIYDICDYFRTLTKSQWIFRLMTARFVIVAENEDDCIRIAKAIEDRFTKPFEVSGTKFDLSVSPVYFTVPDTFESAGEFIAFIEAAYNRKFIDGQINKITDSEIMLHRLRRDRVIISALRDVVKTGEGVHLVYQPVYDYQAGKYVSAEVLLRMHTDELGDVSPGEFIPLAEQSGLGPRIDNLVLNMTCNFLKAHPEAPLLHVNLSGSEFYHNPEEHIKSIIEGNGIDPSRICLEITETMVARYPELIKVFMENMKGYGFSFALDDFGTGYSNITQAVKLPFSCIKLDRTLLDKDEKISIFLCGLLDIMNKMGVDSLMEGVETEEQLDYVVKNGVKYIQGFLFSRPLSEESYVNFLKVHHDELPKSEEAEAAAQE